jgi:hypothetical protein
MIDDVFLENVSEQVGSIYIIFRLVFQLPDLNLIHNTSPTRQSWVVL